MAVSDVIPQDGGQGNVKLHPYLITLVRWCASCLWSTASVLLHRLVTAPLPPITAGRQAPRAAARPRQAGTEHLHPEARVECVVLHAPPAAAHALDVIFVHGLYGSLGNTWRQGEWRTKYKLDPTKIPLRNHSTEPCSCVNLPEHACSKQEVYAYETDLNETSLNENVTFKQLNGCFNKILPNENCLITEQFYNNTLVSVDVDNYDTQAKFVTQLFKNDCDTNCDVNTFKCNFHRNGFKCNADDRDCSKCNSVNSKCKLNECKCKLNVRSSGGRCEVGCGCVCDECYSQCWPRDWIKEDFPGARVLSINYTSDPYLWRPLWVRGNKRLRLHERAEQMMEQLLALGVGQRPIVWVGHSKGGLFIKQIYCEAYEAHLKMNKNVVKIQNKINNNSEDQSDREYNTNNIVHASVNNDKYSRYNDGEAGAAGDDTCQQLLNNFIHEHNNNGCTSNGGTNLRSIDEMNEIRNNNNSGNNTFNEEIENKDKNQLDLDMNYNIEHDDNDMEDMYGCTHTGDVLNNKQARYNDNTEYIDISISNEQLSNVENDDETTEKREMLSSNHEEDSAALSGRASLWSASCGFMFYSVPHRGSPLADIKTPITSRSVELQEIAKDCPLVLELQARWLAASRAARPLVRSLVETCRTLMSVLWLRIVSEDSADAGVGALHGVSVDHREICKPSSRRCPLYTELTDLIRAALLACRCRR